MPFIKVEAGIMRSGSFYRRVAEIPESGEVYLRVRSVNGNQALCDQLVLADHEEDDRVYHNLVVPVCLLETDYRVIDENNPLIDILYPIYS